MSNTNNLTRKPENFFLVCLFIVTALDVISTVYTKNLKILDMALVVLCVISAFSIIGTSLMNAGKDKSLEFGVIAGRYIRLVSIAIGSVICFLALVLAYSVFKDEMHSVNWIFFTAILILSSLLVIAFAIIGVVVAVAAAIYGIYRFFTPDYLDDFEDDFDDDFDNDFFEDEDDEPAAAKKEEASDEE